MFSLLCLHISVICRNILDGSGSTLSSQFFVDTFDFFAWEGGREWNFQDRYRSFLDKFLIIFNCHGLTERFTVYDRHPKESLLKFPTDWKWVLWQLQAQSLFSHLVFAHSITQSLTQNMVSYDGNNDMKRAGKNVHQGAMMMAKMNLAWWWWHL